MHEVQILSDIATAIVAATAAALLARGLQTRRGVDFLGAGCFLAWCVFLKPIFVVPLALVAVGLFLPTRSGLKTRQALLLLAPFLVMETLWVGRNMVVLGSFVPSQYDSNAGYKHRASLLSLVAFVQDIGGDFTSWNPKAEIRWFDEFAGQPRTTTPNYLEPPFPLPPILASSGIPASELFETRRLVLAAVDSALPEAEREVSDRAAHRRIEEHRKAYARARPLERWVVAPIRITKAYLFQSGTTNLFPQPFSSLSLSRKAFKVFQSGLFALSLVLGVPAAMLAVWSFLRAPLPKSTGALLPAVIVLFFSLAFPLVMRRAEYRYLVPAYPFSILLGCTLVLGRRHGAHPAGEMAEAVVVRVS